MTDNVYVELRLAYVNCQLVWRRNMGCLPSLALNRCDLHACTVWDGIGWG